MRAVRPLSLFLTSCLLFATVGCGSDDGLGRRAVSGSVTLDGSPLEDGSIAFQPVEKSKTPSGALISKGKYSIAREQGLPPGKYRVEINAIKPGTGMTLPEGKFPGEEVGIPQQEMIPASWNSKSKQFIEISESGSTEFKHEISSKGN